MGDEVKMYLHSKCCGAHWELVLTCDETMELRCEQCGERTNLQISTPDSLKEDVKCSACGEEIGKRK